MLKSRFSPKIGTFLKRFDTNGQRKYPKVVKTSQIGMEALHNPLWNKGMAFSMTERDRMGLRGLLPPIVKSQAQQIIRALEHIKAQPTPMQKNLYLQDLHNRNETLFHRILVDYIEDIAPLVYTPTVGDVCLHFGNHFTRSRGMYFSRDDRGLFSTMVHNWPHDEVQVIVVTDGSRILGLGDLGANGMGIPIGKLALYCAAGGIAPHRVLPVVLDVGTNNEALLNNPDYIGVRARRLEGEEYFEMVDEFINAVFQRWPGVVLQFEDFETTKAVPLLEKYGKKFRIFNDDIQGTGCVVLSAFLSAARDANSSLKDLKILCAGAGSAGLGVCSTIHKGMLREGMTDAEARSRFVLCEAKGALGRNDGVFKSPHYASPMHADHEKWVNNSISDGASLLEAVKQFKPNVLLGLSAQPKIFTEELVRTMQSYCERPIIMPLSNPTSRAECSAEEAFKWTDGKAIVATGSPFPSWTHPSGKVYTPSQCNNMYIFPGLGLGAYLAGVTNITDGMLHAASVACTNSMTPAEIAEGRTFPSLKRIRIVSHAVAVAVIEQAFKEDVATKITNRQLREAGSLSEYVSSRMYYPSYVPLVKKED